MATSDDKYNSVAGFVYIFNLIVGAGALALPRAFSEAGLLLSAIVVVTLAFLSFVTCSFMVESMAIANAFLKGNYQETENEGMTNEEKNLLENSINEESLFKIEKKVEMGEMARMFFGKIGIRLFYLCIAIYLYGDLAIYATAVPKSLRDVICEKSWSPAANSSNSHVANVSSATNSSTTSPKKDNCFGLKEDTVYRIIVAAFAVLVGPFAFTNVQKTKYIQYITTLLRWLCFGLMIVVAVVRLGRNKGAGNPSIADFSGTPDLFGASVYSFMCQHSLPSLITPLRSKRHVNSILFLDVGVALLFYSLLSFTALFTFEKVNIKDVYTSSFNSITPTAISKILSLYPVFALSASFPVICITLRENLKALFRRGDEQFSWPVERILIPFCAVLPPIAIALCTTNVEMLVGITGSYAGVGVQYIIPTMLLYYGRQKAFQTYDTYRNEFASWFRHKVWIWIILIWTLFSVSVVTAFHIKKRS